MCIYGKEFKNFLTLMVNHRIMITSLIISNFILKWNYLPGSKNQVSLKWERNYALSGL